MWNTIAGIAGVVSFGVAIYVVWTVIQAVQR